MDKMVEMIIKQVAEEQGVTKTKVTKSVQHMCNWTRHHLIEMTYPAILWGMFGTFQLRKNYIHDEEILEKIKAIKKKPNKK